MTPLELVQQRVSAPLLTDPGPDEGQFAELMRAALRAPDHANLKPFRFIRVEGDDRVRLGELFLAAAEQDGEVSEPMRNKLLAMPLRAPMLLVVVARLSEHPKVPEVEQLLCTGAAAQNILLAAHAMGLGGIWRTGDMAYHPKVMQGLGLGAQERIVGFLYLGTPERLKAVPEPDWQPFATRWSGQ